MSANRDFLDSNVIVYGFDVDAPPAKVHAAREIVADGLTHQSAVISWQVVQETLNIASHKLKPAMTVTHRQHLLDTVLQPLWRVQPSAGLLAAALDLRERHGYSWYDSLIIAAALEAGCKRLLTEDLQHGQRIGGLRIENPFL